MCMIHVSAKDLKKFLSKIWCLLKILQHSSLPFIPGVSVQFSSFAWSCPTLCDRMDCSMPGFPVHHQSQSLLKLMSIELVMPSNHLILCHPLLLLPSIFPSIRLFFVSQFFTSGGQSIGVSASASLLLMNIQG